MIRVAALCCYQGGNALQHATAILDASCDQSVVCVAVAQNGDALRFASARLRNRESVVRVAVAQTGDALRFASARLASSAQAFSRMR